MSSSSLVSNRYFDKLVVNSLQVQEIKTDKTYPERKQYLYSIILKAATFHKNENGGILSFTRSNTNIIQFTDRPFQKSTSNFNFDIFAKLFEENNNSNNSFYKDPPNGVLVIEDKQKTYKITLNEYINDKITFNLTLLEGESNIINKDYNGRINLFVDPGTDTGTDTGTIQSLNLEYFSGKITINKYDTITITYEFIDKMAPKPIPINGIVGKIELSNGNYTINLSYNNFMYYNKHYHYYLLKVDGFYNSEYHYVIITDIQKQ